MAGRKPKKNPSTQLLLLKQRDEIIKAINKRHLKPVLVRGFLTIADIDDYYENSYPVKEDYQILDWDSFFQELEKRKLVVIHNPKTGWVKLVRDNYINKHKRYFSNI